jgi:hypothetical protein
MEKDQGNEGGVDADPCFCNILPILCPAQFLLFITQRRKRETHFLLCARNNTTNVRVDFLFGHARRGSAWASFLIHYQFNSHTLLCLGWSLLLLLNVESGFHLIAANMSEEESITDKFKGVLRQLTSSRDSISMATKILMDHVDESEELFPILMKRLKKVG